MAPARRRTLFNKWVEAKYVVEKDIDKMGDMMIARIEEKRAALGI